MLRRNIALFKTYEFCFGLWLFSALAIIYFARVTSSYALGMLAFAFVNIAQSIAEIPCGMFSDRISRKTTLLLGNILILINMILWALAGLLSMPWLLFIGSVLRGIGLAFKSGTDTAMIYETLQQIRQRKLFTNILSKINAFYQLGALVAAFGATFITYYFSLQTLVCLAIIPSFINVIITALMVSPKNCFEQGMSAQKQLAKSLSVFRKNKKLRRYALLQIFNHALSVSVFRFESTYFEMLVPLYFVNIARALQHATGWLSFQLVPLVSKMNLLKLLCYSTLGSTIVRFAALVMNNPITPFFTSLQNLFYGAGATSSTTLLQKEYNKGLRATLDSIVSLFGGLATAGVGYLLGLFADICSPRAILFVAVGCSLLLAFFYGRLFKPTRLKK